MNPRWLRWSAWLALLVVGGCDPNPNGPSAPSAPPPGTYITPKEEVPRQGGKQTTPLRQVGQPIEQ